MDRAHSHIETPSGGQRAHGDAFPPASDWARSSNSILQLQRSAGNQAANLLLSPLPSFSKSNTRVIQKKPSINTPGDAFEREADRIADHVTQMPDSHVNQEPDVTWIAPGRPESEGAPPVVSEVLQAPGMPLDSSARNYMEGRFGSDFSNVRVYTGTRAAESAEALNANAYTTGSDIVFGSGQYSPETQTGRRLLSHELAHVIQQTGAPSLAATALSSQGCPTIQRDTRPTPPNYNNNRKTLGPVPQGLKLAEIKANLDAAKPRDLTSYSVSGVARGSNEEIFLHALIYQVANRTVWNTESDIVAPINWPPSGNAPAPLGRITVRISNTGVATAELLDRGSVPGVAQTNSADGVTRLKTDFGFASVSGWSGTNPTKDGAEISDVLAALDLLKTAAPDDVKALKGVDLIRVPSLPNSRAGEFFPGNSPATQGGTKTNAHLKLANLAFELDTNQFVGGGPGSPTRPASFQAILHEVGHAVEAENLRAGRDSVEAATDDLNKAKQKISDASSTYNDDLKAAKAKGGKAVRTFYDERKKQQTQNEAEETSAQNSLNSANTQLKNAWAAGSTQTVRLKKFVDLVNAKNIKPFTKYANDNWPGDPEEFYAEAYSLWLTDSNFLKNNYREIFDFFQSGDYRK